MEAFTIGGSSGELMFASPPDFEAPADMGMDNVYQVTVKAEAGGEMDMMEVTVTVTNEEETGEVTLWAGTDALTMAPQVGDTITGAVMDPDGGVMDESWQWSRTMTPDMMDSWMDIDAATDAAYMVAAGDTGYYLRVMATYTDAAGTDMAMEYSMPTMMVTMNAAPMFDSETGTREVAENTAAGENVGAPVTAMDADNDTLTYSLGGTDMASFDIDPATGQLMTKADLDYEMPRGMAMSDTNTNTYMVTVTAADPDGASDSIMVTIMVTDVDENVAPMFAADTATRMVAENTAAGMSVGAPVMATDANGDTLAYTLGGTDAASFDIGGSTGQLMTKADLDYEMPRGMAMSETNTNTYMVTVTATDPDGLTDSIDVTITVTDVDEEVVGRHRWSPGTTPTTTVRLRRARS